MSSNLILKNEIVEKILIKKNEYKIWEKNTQEGWNLEKKKKKGWNLERKKSNYKKENQIWKIKKLKRVKLQEC
jgi:hypothetical protein